MSNPFTVIAVTIAVMFVAVPSSEATGSTQTLELFGTPLQSATRDQLRAVLKEHGLGVVREDDRYWVDVYNSSSVLEGSDRLRVGYVKKTGQFAFAAFRFPAFMGTDWVTKIKNMVARKYGAPDSNTGHTNLGKVRYWWSFPGGMYIMVTRGRPDTTTFLDYLDSRAYVQMKAEKEAAKKPRMKAKAKKQSGAFWHFRVTASLD